jgi:hypothetical protein
MLIYFVLAAGCYLRCDIDVAVPESRHGHLLVVESNREELNGLRFIGIQGVTFTRPAIVKKNYIRFMPPTPRGSGRIEFSDLGRSFPVSWNERSCEIDTQEN